ncbi:MAG: DUF4097 family beta strand repeat-containing protein [Candidatus Methylopumilus sp.]
MSSIATIIVTGILFMYGNKEQNITPKQKKDKQAAMVDSSTISPNPTIQPNQLPIEDNRFLEKTFIQPWFNEGLVTLPFAELDPAPALVQLDPIFPSQSSTKTSIQSNAGSWFSSNDSLRVDTLFNGVKSLVFKGDKSDILISGSNRADISMKYNYQLKAKGVFSRKKEGNCELSYVLKDSVLSIHLRRKDQNFNGISVLSESSKIEFYVPDNVDVKMDSDLGDIDANGLKNKNTTLHTALGDITTENVSGNIDLNTDLGDISMNELSGKINSFTSLGDIHGGHILISDNSKFNTSLGDIDVQLSNPISELRLDLSTSLGKVKVDRPELKKKASSQLTLGSGKFKIVMKTALGKVIVR